MAEAGATLKERVWASRLDCHCTGIMDNAKVQQERRDFFPGPYPCHRPGRPRLCRRAGPAISETPGLIAR